MNNMDIRTFKRHKRGFRSSVCAPALKLICRDVSVIGRLCLRFSVLQQAKQLSSGAPSRNDGSVLSRASIIIQHTPSVGLQQANSVTKKVRWMGEAPRSRGVYKRATNVEDSGCPETVLSKLVGETFSHYRRGTLPLSNLSYTPNCIIFTGGH